MGRGWPLKFAGDFDDYLRLDVPLRVVDRWDKTHGAVRSRWPNAVLNQRILRYNFAAKTPWPTASEH